VCTGEKLMIKKSFSATFKQHFNAHTLIIEAKECIGKSLYLFADEACQATIDKPNSFSRHKLILT
jgi:hypothetical protein